MRQGVGDPGGGYAGLNRTGYRHWLLLHMLALEHADWRRGLRHDWRKATKHWVVQAAVSLSTVLVNRVMIRLVSGIVTVGTGGGKICKKAYFL